MKKKFCVLISIALLLLAWHNGIIYIDVVITQEQLWGILKWMVSTLISGYVALEMGSFFKKDTKP